MAREEAAARERENRILDKHLPHPEPPSREEARATTPGRPSIRDRAARPRLAWVADGVRSAGWRV